MPAPEFDDLLAVPLAALLGSPMSSADVAATLEREGGVVLAPDRAGGLLARMAELGLARIAGHEGGEARYVATSLGQRAAAAVLTADDELRVGLEELERLRTELLATIGHELRTPLTAIRTSVGLLLDPGLDPTPEQEQQLLVTIGRSADRMQRLLTELLDLARLRAGRVEMARAEFDARAMLRDVAAAVGPMAVAHEQRVRADIPDAPVTVIGDRRWLEHALLNLAANAQKVSPPGGEIALAVTAANGGVTWSVRDHGPGIPPAARARLFERFFVGATDRPAAGATGLGLPTALAIAQAHGGTIEVDSEVGRGSTFRLVVPAGTPG